MKSAHSSEAQEVESTMRPTICVITCRTGSEHETIGLDNIVYQKWRDHSCLWSIVMRLKCLPHDRNLPLDSSRELRPLPKMPRIRLLARVPLLEMKAVHVYHCGTKFFSGNGEKMKKNFETLTTHLLKECTKCDDDTKSALTPAAWQSKNRIEHTQINEKFGNDVLDVWVKLCGQKADKEAYIRQYVHDLVEEFKEMLSKRRDIKLHPKHISVHVLLQQEDVLKLIVMIHRWISMSDSEREAVGLDDIVAEATKVGVDLKDIWPDLREKYDHHINHSSRSKGEFMKSAVHKIIRV